MAHFDIGSLNVWGLRDKNKRHEMFTWLNAKDLSIVFLQETHCTSELEDLWKNVWGHEIYFSNDMAYVFLFLFCFLKSNSQHSWPFPIVLPELNMTASA